MESNLQSEIHKCMAEIEDFLRKKRLRYEDYMALGGLDWNWAIITNSTLINAPSPIVRTPTNRNARSNKP